MVKLLLGEPVQAHASEVRGVPIVNAGFHHSVGDGLRLQPFDVSEKFTGIPGTYVPLKETIRGFKEILEGKHDSLPESAFLFVGTIDEAVEKAKRSEE